MANHRSDYGLMHALRKFISNLKAIPLYVATKLRKKNTFADISKLVLIISFPRSGTHALASMINHPRIGMHYYGEFFIFNQWSPIVEHLNRHMPFFSWRYFLNTRKQKREWIHFRFEKTSLDPMKTLRKIMLFPGTHTIKIFPEHLHPQTLDQIIKEFKPHVIFLRRNHLDRYVSLKKARATGNWHKVDSSKIEIEVSEPELNKYIDNYIDFYQHTKAAAKANNCKILDLAFKDLNDPDKVLEIQNFVALNSNTDLGSLPKHPTTTKMDKAAISQEKYLAKVNKKISDYDFESIP